jgi:hypothetical protein
MRMHLRSQISVANLSHHFMHMKCLRHDSKNDYIQETMTGEKESPCADFALTEFHDHFTYNAIVGRQE